MNVDDQLRRAGDRLNAELTRVPVPHAPQPLFRVWRALAFATGLTIVIGGSVLWVTSDGEHDGGPVLSEDATSTTSTTLTSEPVFGEPVGVVLLFDDGIDGVLAVDPDRRVGSRSVVDGQRAGDQPYRLRRADDRLVVGWGEIYAADIATRESVLLGSATIFVPAAEPDRVWLINYPGGRIGQGTPQAWQVSVAGDDVTEPTPVESSGFPATGIPGGLALETTSGVAIWDATTGQLTEWFGTGSGFVSDVSGVLLAWCEADCDEFHISNTATSDDLTTPRPEGLGPFDARSARFSPDGRYLAAPAQGAVVLIDTQTGTAKVAGTVPVAEPGLRVGWSTDGSQLFASTDSYGKPATTVLRYRISDEETDIVEFPFGGALSFVVLDAIEATTYFNDQTRDPEDCPPVNIQPSGRTGICGFHY